MALAATEFFVGQRWVSNTEAELGLGIVSAVEGRQVTFDFPAVEEQRTYAAQSAPVSRVIYQVGDLAQNQHGVQFRVDEFHDNNGNIIYFGTDLEGESVVVPENDLESAVQFSRPNDRLLAGQIDKLKFHKLRLDTLEHHHRQLASPVFGLLGGRVQTLPHQFYIASQVSCRHAPRVLLADEVGLGKTIEA
ncbi:MAG: RNA polymerase-associated protein RapA, partial [Pontibacterium sp.]